MSTRTEIIAKMIHARELLDKMPRPEPAMKMHPDDIAELRRHCGLQVAIAPYRNIFGVMIIPDESAPRLPRVDLLAGDVAQKNSTDA